MLLDTEYMHIVVEEVRWAIYMSDLGAATVIAELG